MKLSVKCTRLVRQRLLCMCALPCNRTASPAICCSCAATTHAPRSDCTVKGRSLSPGRHSYHDWCLGDPRLRPGLRPWANVTASLGHKRVDLLKLDIEVRLSEQGRLRWWLTLASKGG